MSEQCREAALLLGSNLGYREGMLEKAISLVTKEAGVVLAESGLYETAAWGLLNQPDFLNQAIVICTLLTPQELIQILLHIERELGRVRGEKWSARTIDIDILYYENEVINSENLQLPHPYLPVRRFSLMPLAEIRPEWIHPLLNLSTSQLLTQCPDEGEVRYLSKP